MSDRSKDWFAQAERDLRFAAKARTGGDDEWACFAAQQAAEKAVKALHLYHSQEHRGHSVRELLQTVPVPAPAALIEDGRILDAFYIPTRYANGLPAGAPFESFGPAQSAEAIRAAESIVGFARAALAETRPG